jgi:hypothetical protein
VGTSPASGLQFQVTAVNQGYGTDSPPDFLASVFWRGTRCYSTARLSSTFDTHGNPAVTLALPTTLPFFAGSTALPPGLELSVALAQADSLGSGPWSPASALLLEAPRLVEAAYTPGDPAGALAVSIAYPPGGPAQAAAQVIIWQGTASVAQTTVVGTTGTVPVTLAADTAYTATVAALAGQSLGVPSEPLALLSTPPTVAVASYDGTTVRASWSAPGSAAGATLVRVTSDGVTVASATVAGTSAALAVPAGADALSVAVAAVGAVSRGPFSPDVSCITAAPTIASALTDPIAGTTTISWSAPPGMTTFRVQLYTNGVPSGQPVDASTASYALSQPLTPDADLAVAVAAAAVEGGVRKSGPFSVPFRLPTAQPILIDVDYDGAAALVAWRPAAGATGYTVSVLEPGATGTAGQVTVGASATSAVLEPTIGDRAKAYSVVVQATVNGSSGPPSAPMPLFSPAFFVSAAPASQAYPHVYPATALAIAPTDTNQALAPADTTVYLPDLGLGASLHDLPLSQGAFALAQNPTEGTRGRFPYTLTIPGSSGAWTFDTAPIRQQLQSDSVAFLKRAETAGVVPWGIATLQEVISRCMPQTFPETLYYAYGLDLVQGYADLRPGMVLQVAFDDYQNVGASAASPWLDGYVGGPVVEYDVGSYRGRDGWRVGFDAFIAQLVASGAVQVSAPQSLPGQQTGAGVADAADLFYPAFQQPFYRLFFPSQLASPSGAGTVLPQFSFVLAAAPSYATLTATGRSLAPNSATVSFRGRALVKLGIRVTIDGVQEVVPIGTTVGNVLERYAQRPPGTAQGIDGLVLERALGPVVRDPAARFEVGQTYRVRLDWGSLPVYGPAQDALSLPLLHGDVLTIGM